MLTIVALLGLLIAPRIAATACGHPADRDVTAGAAAVSMPAAASTDAAQEADDPRTDRALLGSVVAVDGGPSALELEEPQEELHALAAAVGRRGAGLVTAARYCGALLRRATSARR